MPALSPLATTVRIAAALTAERALQEQVARNSEALSAAAAAIKAARIEARRSALDRIRAATTDPDVRWFGGCAVKAAWNGDIARVTDAITGGLQDLQRQCKPAHWAKLVRPSKDARNVLRDALLDAHPTWRDWELWRETMRARLPTLWRAVPDEPLVLTCQGSVFSFRLADIRENDRLRAAREGLAE